MAGWNESSCTKPLGQLPFKSDPIKAINILLLGETGVGKSTFINAFANYLVYDTLDTALQGEMQVLIPSKFPVAEMSRLIGGIVKCDLHAVRDMQSLNEAQQLIRKLPRPIAEVATLIQENIQLAEQHKKKVLANAGDITPNQIPEKTAKVVSLRHPRTICTSKKCSKVTRVNDEMKVDYTVQCHEHCYLKGVEQDVINNPVLKHCSAMDEKNRVHAINPTYEDVIEYINHFIREEKQKLNAGDDNKEVIRGLENMIKEYQDEFQLLRANVDNEAGKSDVPTLEEIFVFKYQLCELPIAGKYIQAQMDSLDANQTNLIEQREEYIQLPANAETSVNMQQLRQVVS